MVLISFLALPQTVCWGAGDGINGDDEDKDPVGGHKRKFRNDREGDSTVFDQRSERNKQQRNNYDQQERQPFMVADKHQQHRQRHGMIL